MYTFSFYISLYAAGWLIQNDAKNLQKRLKLWDMGTHRRVLSKSFPMNTNMTGFLCLCVLDKSSLSIGRVNSYGIVGTWLEGNNREISQKRQVIDKTVKDS